jgi:hypothetical protein
MRGESIEQTVRSSAMLDRELTAEVGEKIEETRLDRLRVVEVPVLDRDGIALVIVGDLFATVLQGLGEISALGLAYGSPAGLWDLSTAGDGSGCSSRRSSRVCGSGLTGSDSSCCPFRDGFIRCGLVAVGVLLAGTSPSAIVGILRFSLTPVCGCSFATAVGGSRVGALRFGDNSSFNIDWLPTRGLTASRAEAIGSRLWIAQSDNHADG